MDPDQKGKKIAKKSLKCQKLNEKKNIFQIVVIKSNAVRTILYVFPNSNITLCGFFYFQTILYHLDPDPHLDPYGGRCGST